MVLAWTTKAELTVWSNQTEEFRKNEINFLLSVLEDGA